MANTTNVNALVRTTASGVVTAMVFSGFAQAMGVLMASAELGVAPLGQLPTEKGIADLKSTYGNDVVNKAIAVMGKDADIISLALAVEGEFNDDLRAKYGDFATDTAIEQCGITDVASVKIMAASLHSQGMNASTPASTVEKVASTSKKKGRQKAQPVKDTKTGIVYKSKAAAGMAVAPEYGLNVHHFVWYEILKKDPKRFVRV